MRTMWMNVYCDKINRKKCERDSVEIDRARMNEKSMGSTRKYSRMAEYYMNISHGV